MQQAKTFLKTFINSVSNPAYYRDVLKVKFSFSLKYFLLLTFLLSLLKVGPALVDLAKFDHAPLARQILKGYPDDLAITIGGGKLSINQPLPYVIPLNDEAGRPLDDEGVVQNLAVFTSEDVVLENGIDGLRDYNSFLVITESNVYTFKSSDSGEVRIYEIPDSEETVVIDEQLIAQGIQGITNHPLVKNKIYLVIAALLLILVLFWGTFIGYMFAILFYALVIHVANKFSTKLPIGYSKIYQVILHSITLIMLVDLALSFLEQKFFSGWIYLLALTVWTLYVLKSSKPVSSKK